MIQDFDYWPDAQAVRDELATDETLADVHEAVNRTLARLAANPYDRLLGTKAFVTPELGGINATPIRLDDWYIFWQRGPEPTVLDIVLIEQLDIGRES
jgi:hypothetical protein